MPVGRERRRCAFQVAHRVIVIRLQRQRCAEFDDCLVDLLLSDQREAEEVVRGGIVRGEARRVARMRDGVVEIVLLQKLERKISLR